jgi:hypothetical protein
MSVLVRAAERLKADVGGITHATPEPASGPTREPVRPFTTDLGNIEHIIGGAGFVQSISEQTSTALVRATDSLRGPHGGLIPSSLQHAAAAGVSRVDGQQLMTVEQRAATGWEILKARVRALTTGRRG